MSETLSKQFNAHIGSRVSYRLTKEGYFDKTGSVIITEDGQVIDLTDTDFIPYDSQIQVVYNPQNKATVTVNRNYNLVGEDVTVTDEGIASGFSDTSWILISNSYKVWNSTLHIAFTTPSVIGNESIAHATGFLTLETKTDSTLVGWSYETSKNGVSYHIEPNTKYYVKIAVSSSKVRSYYIHDDTTTEWTEIGSYYDQKAGIGQDKEYRIGQKSTSEDKAFTGTIDLLHTYITNNNDTAEDEGTIIYRPFSIDVDSSDLICAPSTTLISSYKTQNNGAISYYTIADETIVVNNIHYAEGLTYKKRNELKNIHDVPKEYDTANFTNVGNVSIINHVASGFDMDDFLTLGTNGQFNRYAYYASNWEWNFKIELNGPGLSGQNGSIQSIFSQGVSYETNIRINNDNTISFTANPNSGSSSGIGGSGSTVLEYNKPYWIKLAFTGSAYKLYLSEDGENFVKECEVVSSNKLNSIKSEYRIGGNYNANQYYRYPFHGKVYLDECYILVNRKVWWKAYESIDVKTLRDKHKDVKLVPLNLDLNNDVKLSNGKFLYNFDGNNYASIPTTFNPGNNPWEIDLEIKTSNDMNSATTYFFGSRNGDNGFLIGSSSNGQLQLWLSSTGTNWDLLSGAIWNTYTLSNNTTYYLKLIFDGSLYTLQSSTNNSTWTIVCRKESTAVIHPTKIYFGSPWDKDTRYFRANGNFNLNNIKILVNNQITWKPEFIYAPEDEATKIPNFTIIGNPTVNYVKASGFDENNFLQVNNYSIADYTNLEFQIEFTTGSNVTQDQTLFGRGSYRNINLGINASSQLYLGLCSVGNNSYDILSNQAVATIVANTTYTFKLTHNGTTYKGYLTTNETTTEVLSLDSSSKIADDIQNHIGAYADDDAISGNQPFLGTILLENTYIKANDEIVWKPWTSNDYVRLFKTFGNPNISDNNIASGFSTSNALLYLKTLQNTFSNLEIKMKLTTGSDISTNQIFFCTTENPRCPIAINVYDSRFRLFLASTTSDWNICNGVTGNHTIAANTTYYIKLVYNGSNYILSYSTDDSSYTNTLTVNNSTKIASFTPTFGTWVKDGTSGDGSYFMGSLHLEECYIKVDNKLWWKGIVTEDDDIDFEQPILSANGTIGGDYFAASASSTLDSNTQPWKAFDGTFSTDDYQYDYWHSAQGLPQWLEWYNPYPIQISNLKVKNRNNTLIYIKDYIVSYSDDGTNFIECASGASPSQTALAEWNIPISEAAGHKYWRLTVTSATDNNYAIVVLLNITGKIKPSNTSSSGEEIDPLENDDKNYYAFGNLQINDGIVSGFGSYNTFVLPKLFIPKPTDTFDINIKFKTPSSLSDLRNIFAISEPLMIRLNGSYLRLSFLQTTSWSNYDLWTLSTNTTYTVRCYYTGSTLYVYLYNSAGTLINSTSYSDSSFLRFNWYHEFCIGSQGNGEFWAGTIDLNGSYIKINGNYWWKPFEEETPEETVLKTKYIVQTPVKETDLTTYNNYRVVGSLTNDNGIYSGFSSSNYINYNIGNGEAQSFDLISCVKLNAHKNYNDVFGFASADAPVGFGSTGKLGRFDTSLWSFGETEYPLNTWIWVRYIYRSNTYSVYGLIDNNYTPDTLPPLNDWELEALWSSYTPLLNTVLRIGNTWNSTGEYFNGSIDLNKTRIVVDEVELPFTINEYRNYSYGTSNGIFNISNKIASGFDGNTGGYISAPSLGRFDTTKPWMIQTKVKLMNNNYQAIINFGSRICLYANSNNQFYIWFGNNYGTSIIDGNYGSWSQGRWYWIRLMWTGSYYACYTSTDGSQYTMIMTHDTGNIVTPSNSNNIFGSQYTSGGAYIQSSGMIDLTETYVVQDGKVTWTPYPDKKFEASEFKGFYVPEFVYTGNEMQVNAYRNTLTSGDAETVLGENPSQAEDVVSTLLLKSDIDIGANNEESFVYNSTDEMFAPNNYCRVKFETNTDNYDIEIKANGTVYTNPNRLYVKPGTKISYIATKPGFMDLEANDIEINQDETLELVFDKREFKFSIDTTKVSDGSTSTDTTYILPIVYNVEFVNLHDNVSIDWGDNTTTFLSYQSSWSQANLTHTYPRAGQYQITLSTTSGYMPRFSNSWFSTNNNRYKLISLDSPMLKLTYGNANFIYAYNLLTICADLFKYNSHITSMQDMFYYCQSLKAIPEGLLKYCKSLVTVTEMFGYCQALKTLPNELFKYCQKIETFAYTFYYCNNLISLPEDLFKYNINATTFAYTFYSCTQLRTMPAHLFDNNKAVTNFAYTFYSCSYLTTIPDNLFKYNLAAYNFNYTFGNCVRVEINPNLFGEDLTTRFNTLQTTTYPRFMGMFMRSVFYGTNCGTAPELWKITPKNTYGNTLSIDGAYCFGFTTNSSYYTPSRLSSFGNRTLTNFWDIPITWGGLGSVNLTVNVE